MTRIIVGVVLFTFLFFSILATYPPIEIPISGWIFDGKYENIYFAILDVDDFLGDPVVFAFTGNNIFEHWNFYKDRIDKYPKESAKKAFSLWLIEGMRLNPKYNTFH